MKNLERLITRVKNMMAYEIKEEIIAQELLGEGWHSDLVHWALKAAKFERLQEDKIEQAQ